MTRARDARTRVTALGRSPEASATYALFHLPWTSQRKPGTPGPVGARLILLSAHAPRSAGSPRAETLLSRRTAARRAQVLRAARIYLAGEATPGAGRRPAKPRSAPLIGFAVMGPSVLRHILRSTLNRLAIQSRRKAKKPSPSLRVRRGPPAMNPARLSSAMHSIVVSRAKHGLRFRDEEERPPARDQAEVPPHLPTTIAAGP